MKSLRSGARALLIVFGVLVGLLGLLVVPQGVGRPVRWEIAAGYVGLATVTFADPSCSPLRTEGIFVVVEIPTSGMACTSSGSVGKVWRYHEYVYVGPDRSHTPAPTRPITYGADGNRLQMYIGPRAQGPTPG